jgi:cobalt-zinc-cadmium efflux system protein
MIAGYILYQGFTLLPETIHILMEGSPKDLETEEVIRQMEGVTGVKSVHHVHIWQLDEHRNALEAHVVVHDGDINNMEQIKTALKAMLEKTFSISHSTLEIERVDSPCQV